MTEAQLVRFLGGVGSLIDEPAWLTEGTLPSPEPTDELVDLEQAS